jgi:hypothetical protein
VNEHRLQAFAGVALMSDQVPSLMGFPNEEIRKDYGEYYTCIVNNIRVFVYDGSKRDNEQWFIELDEILDRTFAYPRYIHTCPKDILALYSCIIELTSGGNGAASESVQGARPDAGDPALDDCQGSAGVDDRRQGRREVGAEVAD